MPLNTFYNKLSNLAFVCIFTTKGRKQINARVYFKKNAFDSDAY